MESEGINRPKKHVLVRIAICTLILVFGGVGMKGLASLKKPPAAAKKKERSIKVKTVTVHPRDYPVMITGYGEAKALTIVALSPEISGKVVHTHPALKAGRIIPAGEILFRIDPADYEAALKEARAGVAQWHAHRRAARHPLSRPGHDADRPRRPWG